MELSGAEKIALLKLARLAVTAAVSCQPLPEPKELLREFPRLLAEGGGGAFVTLRQGQALRGCIGLMQSSGALGDTVVHMARAAALEDPRFSKVRREEINRLSIEISVLSVFTRVHNAAEIILGKHGVMVKQGFRSGVFLPQVATETGWNKERFLSELCQGKAGLPANAWQDSKTELSCFTAEVFAEDENKF